MTTSLKPYLAATVLAIALLTLSGGIGHALQSVQVETSRAPLVVVDAEGVMRYAASGEEASFFGVNYGSAFAHSHRALGQLGIDHREVIDQDVYHFARMGLDAYRIHIWDTEISDSIGNVLANEHLDLLDYTLWRLKERGIRAILTPLTFYDNGYPDGATPTPGFRSSISKGQAPQPANWPVLKRYLEQLVDHVNPYTGLSYREDPNIIVIEIVNEPSHGADTTAVMEYVNELADHIRARGWEKPVFYNISQSPRAAPAVMNSRVEGVSFQWYPAGLVGGREIVVNYLPHIASYDLPYRGEAAFDTKALMVYEFDAADVARSYAYPAMARSFREAGFQWATQFAYDPIGIAFANSDYPTHFLNLAYTPGKGIGMSIASEAFHRLPRLQSYGDFPADTIFGDFRVSHALDLSEMNTTEAFLHSNSTTTSPRDAAALTRIAGVGSSPVVSYPGLGAYFLDRLEEGVWRLEVMPDAIPVRNPFERPAFDKPVSYIAWREHAMSLALPDLGSGFEIRGLNSGNDVRTRATGGGFTISPGAYLLVREGRSADSWNGESRHGNIRISEYAAPPPTNAPPMVRHTPHPTVDAGSSVRISALVAGIAPSDSVWMVVNPAIGGASRIPLVETSASTYEAEIAAPSTPGIFRYWIVVRGPDGPRTFPGGHSGLPTSWNFHHADRWEMQVVTPGAPVELFLARRDHDRVAPAPGGASRQLVDTGAPGRSALRVTAPQLPTGSTALGFALPVAERVSGRHAAFGDLAELVVNAKSTNRRTVDLKVILVDRDANAYSATVALTPGLEEHSLPLGAFERDAYMLLPRPYPGFLPLWFRSADESTPLRIEEIEQIQVIVTGAGEGEGAGYGVEIEAVWLSPQER